MKHAIIFTLFAAVLAGILAFMFVTDGNKSPAPVTSFSECVDAGNPVMESDPRQCRSADGQVFTEDSTANTASATGTVRAVDASGVAADGPYRITIDTDSGPAEITIPSMGINLCAAREQIVDFSSIAVGDVVAVRGAESAGTITPCEASNHYLRVVEPGGEDTDGSDRPISYTPDSAENLISVQTPTREATISSPLEVTGQARGQWFFEATAPVVLTDWDGRIIAEGYVQAEGDWMTEEFVPFSGTLEFSPPADTGPQSIRGTLILQRANLSALPENDAAVEIPVRFQRGN